MTTESRSGMKLGTRLYLGFGAVLALLAVVVALAIVDLRVLGGEVDDMVKDKFPKTMWANNIIDSVNLIARAARNVLLLEDKEAQKKELERIDKARKDVVENLDKLESTIHSPDGRTALARVVGAREQYVKAEGEWRQLVLAGKTQEAREYLFSSMRPVQQKYLDELTALIEFQSKLMEKSGEEAAAMVRNATLVITSLGIAAFVVGVFVAVFITRRLMKQLGGEPDYAALVVKRVAEGDLTLAVELRKGDSESLLAAMKAMQDKLGEVMAGIRTAADAVATGSGQLASGNQDLSQRTEEQASSLEETASSMEELTSTVKQNADNAKTANELTGSASEVAQKGGQVVSQVVDTMAEINDASKKIADIIGVIDGIAFQTNILALNAAVEAARAGEQGRGFAVVASEVRNLAQRSAAAAKEIKTLIGNSVEKVTAGTLLVDQAGKTMDEVVSSVKRVADLVAEISAASVEQSSGIEQVNKAIVQMDQVTQQNAALVEEAAAAAGSMQQQAAHLRESVAVFKLRGSASPAAAPGAVAPHAPPVAKAVAGKARHALPAPAAKERADEVAVA